MPKKKPHPKQSYIHTEKLDGTEQKGLLVAHFGANALIEDSEGKAIRCHLRKNMEPCITGDYVLWRLENNQTGVVVSVLPRKSVLSRPERKKQKLIAANIDAIVIVTAPPPLFSLYLIDRYLIASENLNIKPIILLNKVDLLDENTLAKMKEELSLYEKIGYPVLYSSIYLSEGLKSLTDNLKDKIAVLVGVSGVGKSSIIATLTHDLDILIADTSVASGFGKHTTTTTHLYHLPEGGHLIDSPGVREFDLGPLSFDDIIRGFVEFHPYLGYCKFRDCKHVGEPDCAIDEAIRENKIHPSRFASFCEILREM
jgi:ribosome biogenesis GTPase / thiamine phosphate phosphatase